MNSYIYLFLIHNSTLYILLVTITCVLQQQAWNSSDVWLKPVSSVPIQVLIDPRKALCLHPIAVLCLGGPLCIGSWYISQTLIY